MIRPATLWRAFFCAVGIVLIIGGIECLLIDSAVLVAGVMDDPVRQQASGGLFSAPPPPTNRVFKPSEWFPWSLLAFGTIVMLYSLSLRRDSGPA
ncbi:hypothetical protein SH501x_004016 [Pirellulaceae bacterium SH501]